PQDSAPHPPPPPLYPLPIAGSPAPPPFRFSAQPSIPRAAHRTARPYSSASHWQKSHGQTRLGLPQNVESPLSRRARPNQSRLRPKTPRCTAPSASAPPLQSPHPSET